MDASSFHAHVVRVQEPQLSATDVSPLSSQSLGAFPNGGYYPPSLLGPSTTYHEQNLDRPSPKPDNGSSSNGHFDEVDFPSATASALPEIGQRLPREGGIASPRPHHPRPESSDILEEEDSRRIRFALPSNDDDDADRLRHSLPIADSIVPARTSDHAGQSHDELLEPPMRDVTGLLPAFYRWHTSLSQTSFYSLPPPPPLPLYSNSQLFWDDNLLAVDDHRRSYDFADFMHQWRSNAPLKYDGLPALPPACSSSLWRNPLREYIRHEGATANESDMQGLRWKASGVDRKSALRARTSLHSHRPNLMFKDESQDDDGNSLHYTFRSFAPHHRARPSHYQLRNMIAANNQNDVYYAASTKVMRTSMACFTTAQTAMDFASPFQSAAPFKVTCLSISDQGSDNVIIAGGFNGEYAMTNLASRDRQAPFEGYVSHAKDGIVNHISTFRSRKSGTLHAAFSANDHKVRIMDVHRQQTVNTFQYDSAINCSAMSPDGRLRAIVHDGSDNWITNAENGEIVVKLVEHTDYAFACAWAPCGRHVATGAEDGKVIVWDSRNWARPLQKLDCVMSCARSLQFTDDGVLVIAESEDVVSTVHTKDFGMRQDIRFFGSVAGVALLHGGDGLVVANADKTVGGLLSFRRVAKGRGYGDFGRQLGSGARHHRLRDYEGAVLDDLIV